MSLSATLRNINRAIADRNFELGISFFMNYGAGLREQLPAIWEGEIEPYLEEFFFDRLDKVDPFRWRELAKTTLSDWVQQA
jgi:5-methylcytosine-specific restriction protein B